MDDITKTTLAIVAYKVRTIEPLSREGILNIIEQLMDGLPPEKLFTPEEAPHFFNLLRKGECVQGIMNTKGGN